MVVCRQQIYDKKMHKRLITCFTQTKNETCFVKTLVLAVTECPRNKFRPISSIWRSSDLYSRDDLFDLLAGVIFP